MCRGTHLREGVAARNWFTTIDVSSAIAFPVEDHGRVNKTMLIILSIPLLSVQSKPLLIITSFTNYPFSCLTLLLVIEYPEVCSKGELKMVQINFRCILDIYIYIDIKIN